MAKKQEKPIGGYVVVSPFRDINDFSKAYEEGEDVSHLSDDRLLDLLEKGLIEEVVDEKAAAEAAKAAAAAEKKAEAEKAAALKKQQEEEANSAAEAAKLTASANEETGK